MCGWCIIKLRRSAIVRNWTQGPRDEDSTLEFHKNFHKPASSRSRNRGILSTQVAVLAYWMVGGAGIEPVAPAV